MMLSGWGRFPRADCYVRRVREEDEVRAALSSGRSWIARGNGRSYGDPALNRDGVLDMTSSARFLAFDPESGLLACEAGVLLSEVLAVFTPRGWFPPVTPGTKFVSLGGMVACDVHGKNHHLAGSFSRHIAWLDLMLADGQVVRCGPDQEAELFWATCGGMGLTGVILRLAFQMIRIETPLIRQTTIAAPDLDAAMEAFEANFAATYSVAWIDCLASGARQGRSLVHIGEHARADEVGAAGAQPPRAKKPKRVPIDFPGVALNRFSVTAFNALYYARGKPGTHLAAIDPYFYPLDGLLEWNRIYGSGGFMQHQAVLPLESSREGLKVMLTRIAASGAGSFLAVLKRMGAGAGPLSFPMEGYTLALDFAATPKNMSLLNDLDAIVADHGGRLYFAKDSRSGASALRGYPELAAFRAVRDRVDPERRFRSLQSERLGL